MRESVTGSFGHVFPSLDNSRVVEGSCQTTCCEAGKLRKSQARANIQIIDSYSANTSPASSTPPAARGKKGGERGHSKQGAPVIRPSRRLNCPLLTVLNLGALLCPGVVPSESSFEPHGAGLALCKHQKRGRPHIEITIGRGPFHRVVEIAHAE
jgi:hypothetical protein